MSPAAVSASLIWNQRLCIASACTLFWAQQRAPPSPFSIQQVGCYRSHTDNTLTKHPTNVKCVNKWLHGCFPFEGNALIPNLDKGSVDKYLWKTFLLFVKCVTVGFPFTATAPARIPIHPRMYPVHNEGMLPHVAVIFHCRNERLAQAFFPSCGHLLYSQKFPGG